MALRPEWRRKYYGPAWRENRRAMIAALGNRCSVCGRTVTRYLNVCHLHHDPRTTTLALMCPADHARNDARHAFAVRRRNRARKVGQLWLLPEVEYAAMPAWAIPRRVINALQGRLFDATET